LWFWSCELLTLWLLCFITFISSLLPFLTLLSLLICSLSLLLLSSTLLLPNFSYLPCFLNMCRSPLSAQALITAFFSSFSRSCMLYKFCFLCPPSSSDLFFFFLPLRMLTAFSISALTRFLCPFSYCLPLYSLSPSSCLFIYAAFFFFLLYSSCLYAYFPTLCPYFSFHSIIRILACYSSRFQRADSFSTIAHI
jgi:hypothetical protein